MKERFGRRRSAVGLAFGAALLALASMACTQAKKEAPASPDASIAVATPVAASPVEPAAAAVQPPEPEPEAAVDAGSDAGPRKLRRLVAKSGAAALVETVAAAPPPADPPAPEDPRKGKKVTGAPMSDELPYGGATSGSGAPTLKKTPLPNDDPWAKPPGPTPAH